MAKPNRQASKSILKRKDQDWFSQLMTAGLISLACLSSKLPKIKGNFSSKNGSILNFLALSLILAFLLFPQGTQTMDQTSVQSTHQEVSAVTVQTEPGLDLKTQKASRAVLSGIFTNSLTILLIVYTGFLVFGTYWGDWQDAQDYLYGKSGGVLTEKRAQELIKLTPKGGVDKGKPLTRLRRLKVKEDSRLWLSRGDSLSQNGSHLEPKKHYYQNTDRRQYLKSSRTTHESGSWLFTTRQELTGDKQLKIVDLESKAISKSEQGPLKKYGSLDEASGIKIRETCHDQPVPIQMNKPEETKQSMLSLIAQSIKVLLLKLKLIEFEYLRLLNLLIFKNSMSMSLCQFTQFQIGHYPENSEFLL